jgi:hypothetical protein
MQILIFVSGNASKIIPPRKLKKKDTNYNTHECDFKTQSAISTRRVWFYSKNVISTHTCVVLTLKSVITTRSSVIYTRRVKFVHAEYKLYMQSVTSTRSVISTDTHTHMRVILTRMRINMTLTSVITTRTSVIYARRE